MMSREEIDVEESIGVVQISEKIAEVKEFFENTAIYLSKNFGIRFRRRLVSDVVKDYEFESILAA